MCVYILCTNISGFQRRPDIYIYIHIYISYLATGCRRYRAKTDAKWQKVTKSARNQRKNSPNRQGEFLGRRHF